MHGSAVMQTALPSINIVTAPAERKTAKVRVVSAILMSNYKLGLCSCPCSKVEISSLPRIAVCAANTKALKLYDTIRYRSLT